MSNSFKNVLITPNRSASGIPEIALTGFGNSAISLKIPDSTVGTLDFTGAQTELFSIDADQNSNVQLSIGSSTIGSLVEVKQLGNLNIETPKTTIYGKGLKLSKVRPSTSSSVEGKIAYDSVQKTLVVNDSTTWVSYSSPSYIQNGLILYYDASRPDCYSGSGSSVFDISGSAVGSGEFTGTMNAGAGFSTERGGAFTFNGSTSFIEVSNSSDMLRDFSEYTIEWYVRVTNVGGNIFGNYGPGWTGNTIWNSPNYGQFINGSVPYFAAGSYTEAAPLPAGYTYHTAITRESQNRNTALYLNGFLNNSSTANTRVANGINYRIGLDVNTSTSEPFGGSLYLIRVYNRALTPKEIQTNFESARTRVGL